MKKNKVEQRVFNKIIYKHKSKTTERIFIVNHICTCNFDRCLAFESYNFEASK